MTMTKTIQQEADATLRTLEKKDPGLKQLLKKAYGYAVFPSVGKASLVVGGSYGKGAVYKQGKFVGYATIGQTTIGIQIGGDTYAEVVVFENRNAFEQMKQGKMAFAADASAVLVKAGAAAARGFGNGTKAYVYGKGGMLLEAVIGGQKIKFKPAAEAEKQMKQQEQDDQENQEDEGEQDDDSSAKDESEGGGEDDENADLTTRVAGAARGAWSGVTDFVKEHPVATGAIAVGVAAGTTLLVMRMMRSSDQSNESDDQDSQESGSQDDEQGDEQISSQEDSGEEEDQGEEEESQPRSNGRRRRFAESEA